MSLSRPKSENGLPLRWATCMGSSTSMSQPSPVETPWTHANCTWTTVRSSTSAHSINLVNNPIQRLSPHGTPTFPQTDDGDSPACVFVHHSSLDESWRHWQGVVRSRSKRGTAKPRRHDLRLTSVGRHARRMIDIWRRLERPISPLPQGEGRGEGHAASGKTLEIQISPAVGLETAREFGIVWVSPCSRAPCRLCLSKG
jgi:hypothetical protein